MAGPGNILIKIGADAGQAVRELGTVDKALGGTMSHSEKMSAGLKKAAVPAAAALAGIGLAAIDATKAAADDAAAQEHLAGMLKRTAGASDATIKSTEDWISAQSAATGVADDELRPALEKIVTATKDVGKGQNLMQQAMDISAASGKDLESVSTAIAKAYTGQTAQLEKLIPGLSDSAKKSDDFNVIMGELAKTTGGAMAESADTATGQYKIMTNQMNELQEELGTALLPVMKLFLGYMSKAIGFASEHSGALKVLVGVVAALAGGILVANAALKVYEALQLASKAATVLWTGAQWLLNAALSANPIGLVIIALGLLVGAIVLAYKKSETFRDIVDAALRAVEKAVDSLKQAFNQLKNAAFLAWDWIADHWKLALFAFGPIGAAIYLLSENFGKVKSAAQTAFEYITSVWNVAKFAFGPIQAAIEGIKGAFDAVKGAVDAVVGAIQSLIGWIRNIKWPSVPGFLKKLPGNPFKAAPAGLAGPRVSGLGATTRATSGGTTINVYGPIDPEGTARAILKVLKAHDRRMGLAT